MIESREIKKEIRVIDSFCVYCHQTNKNVMQLTHAWVGKDLVTIGEMVCKNCKKKSGMTNPLNEII